MSGTNGDLITTRIAAFRDELESKYPSLQKSDQLNAALDLARLILGTFTRDAQLRIQKLEDHFCRIMFILKSILSFLSAIVVGLITTFLMKFF